MTETYKVQGYTFIISKKNDTSLSITASPESNKSIFESGAVDLKKVKCETITAALLNSNPKNILMKVHYEESNQPFKGQLLLSFVVKYEFLPEFSEDIVMKQRKLDESDAMKVRLANLDKELEGLNKVMGIIGNEGTIKIKHEKMNNLRDTTPAELQLPAGKYLVQITGLHKANSTSTLGFNIVIEGKTKKEQTVAVTRTTPYFVTAAYSYPFNVSEVIELTEQSTIRVFNKEANSYTSTANNFIVTAKPVLV